MLVETAGAAGNSRSSRSEKASPVDPAPKNASTAAIVAAAAVLGRRRLLPEGVRRFAGAGSPEPEAAGTSSAAMPLLSFNTSETL